MNRHVSSIAGRLSLRTPQRRSLEILADAWDLMRPAKDRDPAVALAELRHRLPEFGDFEREFPSLCFALATGVGKTRLMGAFITYLHVAFGVRHFFVLAPNLTIYEKLIRDFTPNTPKYVFQGISEFAVNPPEVVTGETYDTRARIVAVRDGDDLFGAAIEINVFNISKVNSEVRGGKEPRIKRLREVLGESYFGYLASLPDLVLLMDESHRYRAAAGVRAINELKPILGLELTATPVVETAGKSVRFKNVAFDYPLGQALADGFVKTPCVVTRTNFRPDEHGDADVERIKLEDALALHEETKVELQAYAAQSGRAVVKPFVLVIARDTEHAARLKDYIEGPTFYRGQYAGNVIEIHSGKSGEEAEENVQRLLGVERPDEPTEVVIHVNMLKEGWDVTNLYTIVPLRAANARVLIEQSIGRGLRLPYGERTGVAAVDRLSIVAHDRFQEIVDEANRPDSIVRMETRQFDPEGADVPMRGVSVPPVFEGAFLQGAEARAVAGGAESSPEAVQARAAVAATVLRTTLDVLAAQRGVPTVSALRTPEVQQRIVAEVQARLTPHQPSLPGIGAPPQIAEQVSDVIEKYGSMTIQVPRIVVVPKGEVRTGFRDFDLDPSQVRLQEKDQRLVLHTLGTNEQVFIEPATGPGDEERLENYVVRELMDKDDVDYDRHADLLYKLAGQMVTHLRTYLGSDDAVRNVLRQSQRTLGTIIHHQMQRHAWEESAGYEAIVSQGFTPVRAEHVTAPVGVEPRDFRIPVEDGVAIQRMLFCGFTRCVYPIQKFDVRPEWRFAQILETDAAVERWVKPGRGSFQIRYAADHDYEPDFVVETRDAKYLCEPKRADMLADAEVLAKAKAAVEWCDAATKHAAANGGKPWRYLLIPHDAIQANMTLTGLASQFGQGAK